MCGEWQTEAEAYQGQIAYAINMLANAGYSVLLADNGLVRRANMPLVLYLPQVFGRTR